MTDSSSSSTDPVRIPSGQPVAGTVRVPPSKSVSNRYLNLALLAAEKSLIERPLASEDLEAFAEALENCGCRLSREGLGGEFDDDVCLAIDARRAADRTAEDAPSPSGTEIHCGASGVEIDCGASGVEIHCGASGTMMRLMTGTLTTLAGSWTLTGIQRLCERPIAPLVDALRDLGAEIRYLGEDGFPPLAIRGGSLRGGRTAVDAGESSQYLSAVLMAAQRAQEPVEVVVSSLTSEPYVDLTLDAIEAFGGVVRRGGGSASGDSFNVAPGRLRGQRIAVEGDFSAAAYPAAAAALTGGRVELLGLRQNSLQGDRAFLDLLEQMGAEVRWEEDRLFVSSDRRLVAITADLSHIPDQVPTLAALAPFASGTTRIQNVAHLRLKESDRLAAMTAELRRLGATVEELSDGLVIEGTWSECVPETVTQVQTHGDHRIAMSLAIVGLLRPGVEVLAPEVVAKSYPGFWTDLRRIVPGFESPK